MAVTAYTKDGADRAIAAAVGAIKAPDVDLSGLETTEHAAATYQPKGEYALKSDIPQVPDTSTFATTDALEQGLSAKADKSALTVLETAAHASATYQPKGDYATTTAVDAKIAAAQLSGSGVDLSPYATKDELATKADVSAIPDVSGLETQAHAAATYQPKGDYATTAVVDQKLAAIPATDMSGYVQDADLDGYAKKTDLPDVSGLATSAALTEGLATKADKSEIPDVSGFQPKGDYATTAVVDQKIAAIPATDLSGYVTTSDASSTYATQDALAGKADKSEIPDVSGLATKAEVASGLAAKADMTALSGFQPKGDYALKSEIPAAPDLSTYATTSAMNTALAKKADTTAIPDVSGLATKTEVSAKADTTAVSAIDARVTKLESATTAASGIKIAGVLAAGEGVPAGAEDGAIYVRKAE